MLTEAKARTKWCPQALHQSGGEEPAANRWADRDGHHPNPAECRCLASECMAWRWAAMPAEFPMLEAEAEALVARDDNYELAGACPSTSTSNIMVRRIATTGFCGLAGQVEG